MSWYKQAKSEHSAEIKSLEIQIQYLQDKRAYLPKWIAFLQLEQNTIPRQVEAFKNQINELKKQ